MKLLTFNWHEAYLCLLAKTGHSIDIVERFKGGSKVWFYETRPLPANGRIVKEATARRALRLAPDDDLPSPAARPAEPLPLRTLAEDAGVRHRRIDDRLGGAQVPQHRSVNRLDVFVGDRLHVAGRVGRRRDDDRCRQRAA